MRLSNTSLSMLQRCGEQYRRAIVEGERLPPGLKMGMGRAFHRAAAANHIQQLDALQNGAADEELPLACMPDEQARDYAADAFEEEKRSGIEVTPKEAEEFGGPGRALGVAKDRVVAASSFYAGGVAPSVIPEAIERKIEIDIPDKDVTLVAVIDLVAREGARDAPRHVVRENKLTARKPPANSAEPGGRYGQQLTVYSLAHEIETGAPPDKIVLASFIHRASGKTDYDPHETTRTTEDAQRLAHRISAAIDAIRAGAFMPSAPDSFWCSEAWCGFWPTCRFGGGK